MFPKTRKFGISKIRDKWLLFFSSSRFVLHFYVYYIKYYNQGSRGASFLCFCTTVEFILLVLVTKFQLLPWNTLFMVLTARFSDMSIPSDLSFPLSVLYWALNLGPHKTKVKESEIYCKRHLKILLKVRDSRQMNKSDKIAWILVQKYPRSPKCSPNTVRSSAFRDSAGKRVKTLTLNVF